MPRHYVRKNPEIKPVTEEQIAKAKSLIAIGKSIKEAARTIGISDSCLSKRLRLGKFATSMGRFKRTFSDEQEAKFVKHCEEVNEIYQGLTINDIRRLTFEYATRNKIEHRFDKTSKMAGCDWVASFLERHPHLNHQRSIRTRIEKDQMQKFCKKIKELYAKQNIKPYRIYNVGKICISTDTAIGTKNEISVICCMSAIGYILPPAFVYSRNRPPEGILHGAPPHSICILSNSGFVNSVLFLNWLYHFKYIVEPSQESPVLLFLNNQLFRMSLETVQYARNNNIIILTFPPHYGISREEPISKSFFNLLKNEYTIECEKFKSFNSGRRISQCDLFQVFNKAYLKVTSTIKGESDFRATGIFPFNENILKEVGFGPSVVTDKIHKEEDMEISADESTVDEIQVTDEGVQNKVEESKRKPKSFWQRCIFL